MSWTVACFCGTVFTTPPYRCPNCGVPLPDVEDYRPAHVFALPHVVEVLVQPDEPLEP